MALHLEMEVCRFFEGFSFCLNSSGTVNNLEISFNISRKVRALMKHARVSNRFSKYTEINRRLSFSTSVTFRIPTGCACKFARPENQTHSDVIHSRVYSQKHVLSTISSFNILKDVACVSKIL